MLAFFFQAEDGIRDFHVTGVQTCALPILVLDNQLNKVQDRIEFPIETNFSPTLIALVDNNYLWGYDPVLQRLVLWNYRDKKRSEERRVGKECRPQYVEDHGEKRWTIKEIV